MFDAVAPRYDFLNRLLTIRMDVRWRRAAVKLLALRPGACVLDMACGTGDLCVELTAAGLTPIGIDRSAGMLAAAHTNAPLARADVDDLPLRSGSVDGVTCGLALRNFSRIDTFLASAARVLARGGRLAILEPSRPRTPVLAGGHRLYFEHVVPLVGGLFSDRDAYRYLPQSLNYLPDPPDMSRLISEAGFADVEHRLLSAGIAQVYTATRR
jgi:demethylmenaquinone methyltransferase/2-methoxy-6-polyprenyl-1,4-benzoquinol methylase